MRRLVALLAWLLALPCALALAFAYVPAPALPLAHLGMIAGEKSALLVGVGVVVLVLGWLLMRPGSRLSGCLLTLLGLGLAAGSGQMALAAYRLAHARATGLDLRRWVTGGIELGARPPSDVLSFVYTKVDGHPLHLDAWAPAPGHHHPATPVLVIHGGGWSAGERSEVLHTNEWLAQQGFAVFDMEYRLAPPPNGRAALSDVRCAMAWLKKDAKAEGFDIGMDRLVLLGRSAGGHLALLAGYTQDEPGNAGAGCDTSGVHVAGVVALYPVTDLVSAFEQPANRKAYPLDEKVRGYVGGSPAEQPAAYRQLSPLSHVKATTPPTFLVHGSKDQVVPFVQSRKLAEALAGAGVAHDFVALPWAQHGFDFVVDGAADQLTHTLILQFLRELPLVATPSNRRTESRP
jgi:acetyl esterase/lipase